MTFDVATYLAIPRLSRLVVAANGRVLVGAETLTPQGSEFATAVWQVLPAAAAPAADGPVRLTAPRRGDALLGALPGGEVLFSSNRPDPELAEQRDPDDAPGLWLLPAGPGEARPVSGPLAVSAVAVAASTGALALLVSLLPDATDAAEDRSRNAARREAGRSGLWFDRYPVRSWDRYLGPRTSRLLLAAGPEDLDSARDLTGEVGAALDEASFALDDAGRILVTTWRESDPGGRHRSTLVAIDPADGRRRVLDPADAHDVAEVALSSDGSTVAYVRETHGAPGRPKRQELWVLDTDGRSEPRRLAAGLDRWPHTPVFGSDGRCVYFLADDVGHSAVYRVDLDAPDAAVQLTPTGAHTDLHRLPDGGLVCLRSDLTHPPEVVRLTPTEGGSRSESLHAVELPALPGQVDEVTASAADGTPLRAWLVRPTGGPADPSRPQAPAPLVVWIHGGPLGSWNGWQWRWQPQLLAARGYAVLLPDPALSTGYGQAMVDRGWDEWGGAPYTDVLALTDAALARGDLDAQRTAVGGGSYGGYLTNWTIGHTDRFRCAVTHASLWDLTQFQGTTDESAYWWRMWSTPDEQPQFYRHWSPSTYADQVHTPTLVIHGERDYRVPIGEGLRLWSDLRRRDVASRLLVFPDENHWVLRPGNIHTWYEAMLGWLDQHLLDGHPASTTPTHL